MDCGGTKLRREHAALRCGGEQVLAASADWLVTLRDAGHQGAERCGVQGVGTSHERVMVALHRGSGAASMDVVTKQTWADGCKVSRPLLGEGAVNASEQGIHVSLNANYVLIAMCE